MSKALVIKGANFSANKLATVTLENEVPCTGLTVSQNTITFNALDATVTLIATKTPVNSTDHIVWSSSNADVAAVVDGVVTCTGVGTATITAMCGTQSATCAVSASVTFNLDEDYNFSNGKQYSGSLELPTKNHIGIANDTPSRLYYSYNEYGYQVFTESVTPIKYAIPLPNGATRAIVTPPTGLTKSIRFALANVYQKQTYVSGYVSALGIKATLISSPSQFEIDFSNVADSSNGFILSVKGENNTDASTVSGTTTITFE